MAHMKELDVKMNISLYRDEKTDRISFLFLNTMVNEQRL
jgi:hypothetical protein